MGKMAKWENFGPKIIFFGSFLNQKSKKHESRKSPIPYYNQYGKIKEKVISF